MKNPRLCFPMVFPNCPQRVRRQCWRDLVPRCWRWFWVPWDPSNPGSARSPLGAMAQGPQAMRKGHLTPYAFSGSRHPRGSHFPLRPWGFLMFGFAGFNQKSELGNDSRWSESLGHHNKNDKTPNINIVNQLWTSTSQFAVAVAPWVSRIWNRNLPDMLALLHPPRLRWSPALHCRLAVGWSSPRVACCPWGPAGSHLAATSWASSLCKKNGRGFVR